MKEFDAIIIGGGPAGIMAAIRAAERNKKVLLIEQNNALGRKLLISGNSRCNLTNLCGIEEFLKKFSETRLFLRNSFARFFNPDLMAFFEDAGIKLKVEQNGRVFPKNDKASDVLNVLKSKLENKNIKIFYGERVQEILTKDKEIKGILTHSHKEFLSKSVVIATGGSSYPETGSRGDGYSLAKGLGHEIIPIKPGLSPILIKENLIKSWQGISLKNVRLTLFAGSKKIDERTGDILFTHFGLSGPTILDMSGLAYDALQFKNNVTISINFVPQMDKNSLDACLLHKFRIDSNKTIKNIFNEMLPRGIIEGLLKYCGIDSDKKAHQVTSEERKKLIKGLADFRLTIKGIMPIKCGMVTRGGVNTKEIDPKTMESKLIKGLFFAGEVIDIDAETGGYNMQAAFSTGWASGDNV